MNEQELSILIEKYLAGKCSDEEEKIVTDWYEKFEERPMSPEFYGGRASSIQESMERSHAIVAAKISEKERKPSPIVSIIARVAIAAAIGSAAFFGLRQAFFNKSTQNPSQIAHASDIPAGGDKATLTLDDGSVIALDEAKNGSLAQQGGVTVNKDGAVLSYTNTNNNVVATAGYNTISTPRGGQFHVILPDGTNVWLNAASSLKFPVQFGKERNVTLMGEGYFEVAKDKTRPFHVSINEQDVTVLGTHFNVNGYKDKQLVVATLLEGSVKITNGNGSQLLKPGQQATVDMKNKIDLNEHANVEDVMAWHNGMFIFNSLTIDEILQQVSRWYDVQVFYTANKPTGLFSGKVSRNTNLSEVLKMLEFNGVKYRLDQRQLIIE